MIDLLKEALSSPAGSFSFIFSIVMLGGLVIFYVTRTVTKISTEHGQFGNRIDKIEVNLDRRMDKTEANIDLIKTDIIVMKTDISEMKGMFNTRLGSAVSRKRSPEVLNEEGEKIVSDYNLDVMVHSNWDRISRVINSLGTRNPYDLQEFCFYTAYLDTENIKEAKFFSDTDIDKLKIVAYKTGYPLVIITKVIMGILIRDRYFKENAIDVDDVDKNLDT